MKKGLILLFLFFCIGCTRNTVERKLIPVEATYLRHLYAQDLASDKKIDIEKAREMANELFVDGEYSYILWFYYPNDFTESVPEYVGWEPYAIVDWGDLNRQVYKRVYDVSEAKEIK
jgi:hypothetical protein